MARWTCWCRSCTRARQTRLAGAALAGAHSPRHVRERLRHDDAGSFSGRRGSRETWPASTPARPPWPPWRPTFPTRRAVLPPATKHVVLAALRRGRLPQLQELHPDAGERHSGPLRPRRHLRRLGHEQSMAAPVFGRMGGSRSHHGPLRQKQSVDIRGGVAITPTERRRFPRGCRRRPRHSTPAMSSSPSTLSRSRSRRPRGLATAEASDDEDDAPMPDAPLEPELIDMPPAPASAPPPVGAVHRTARGVQRWTALTPTKNCHLHLISASLCCLACLLSRVSWPAPVFPCPDHQSQAPRQ